jgi:TrmH family RNA methyltransferase
MLSKKEIKDIQSLRYKKERDEMGLFVAEGPKVVAELLEIIPDTLVKIYALTEWAAPTSSNLQEHKVEISNIELEKISNLQTPNQVVAVFKQPKESEPIISAKDYCIYLDAIQDPGNVGTIIRIADWFGIKNIILTEGCADVYNTKVIQASMASIGRLKFYLDKDLNWLQKQMAPIYAAALHGRSVYEMPKNNGGILLIGNESKGLRQELLKMATEKITIPKKGGAESLNAAVATGIILSHLIN